MPELPESNLPTTPEHKTSMEKFVPIGLQYFQTVDFMSTKVRPDNNGYLMIRLYAGEDQPDLIILRLVSKYKNGNTGIQDELSIPTKEDRLQLNAEKNPQGEYVEYPHSLTTETLEYLQKVIQIFNDSVAKEGSEIVINNKPEFVAREGVWFRHQLSPKPLLQNLLDYNNTIDKIV